MANPICKSCRKPMKKRFELGSADPIFYCANKDCPKKKAK